MTTLLSAVACLRLVVGHPGHNGDLIISQLLNVVLVPLNVPTMTSQLNVLVVELLLDDVVLLPQTLHQLLVVHWGQRVTYPVGTL